MTHARALDGTWEHLVRPADGASAPAAPLGWRAAAVPPRLASWLARYGPPLGVYAASRLVMGIAAALASLNRPDLTFMDTVTVWDGLWYRLIAQAGYPARLHVPGVIPRATSVSFFPGYPLVVRLVAEASGLDFAKAGLVVSLTCGGLAVALIWRLTEQLTDRLVADRTAALVSFAPGAFVFSMMYSEGLMLVGVAACLLALSRERWVTAGFYAAAATATRPNATAICLACAVAAVPVAWRKRQWAPLAAPVIAPMGLVAFFTYLHFAAGSFFAWSTNERDAFGEHLDFGVTTARAMWEFFQNPFLTPYIFITGVSFIAIVAGLALLLRSSLPPAVKSYAVAVSLLVSLTHVVGPRPRFLLVAFPLTIALAMRCRGPAFVVILGASAVLMAVAGIYYIEFFILPGNIDVVPP